MKLSELKLLETRLFENLRESIDDIERTRELLVNLDFLQRIMDYAEDDEEEEDLYDTMCEVPETGSF